MKSFSALKLAGAILAAIATLALTSCNTVSGMGRDIEGAGDSIQHAAH